MTRFTARALAAVLVAMPHATRAQTAPIDHVVIGIDSLERGMNQLADITGVTPVLGGVHPGRGTRNALIAIGDRRYLELMAPDPAQAVTSDQVTELRTLHTLTPIGWAIRVTNADSARAKWTAAGLAPSAPIAGSRQRPDGRMLRWRTLDPFGIASPVLPFAIEWDTSSVHPATDAPHGCSLVDFRVTSPHAGAIENALRRAKLDVEVERDVADAIQIGLACPTGRINLP